MVTDKKFTKGEWFVKERCNFESEIRTSDGIRIALTKSYGDGFNDATEEEAEANAKLIAAAPELLEVSMKCLQWCNSAMSPKFVNELRIQAESAIKKATE